MSICKSPGGGGAMNGSVMRGRGLTAPAPPAPLDPADDAVLRGAESVMPFILNWRYQYLLMYSLN